MIYTVNYMAVIYDNQTVEDYVLVMASDVEEAKRIARAALSILFHSDMIVIKS